MSDRNRTCKIPACPQRRNLKKCHRCERPACKFHLASYSTLFPTCLRCRVEIRESLRTMTDDERAAFYSQVRAMGRLSKADIERRRASR